MNTFILEYGAVMRYLCQNFGYYTVLKGAPGALQCCNGRKKRKGRFLAHSGSKMVLCSIPEEQVGNTCIDEEDGKSGSELSCPRSETSTRISLCRHPQRKKPMSPCSKRKAQMVRKELHEPSSKYQCPEIAAPAASSPHPTLISQLTG